eukprot:TRINITY_DN27124_c0_g1_i1.p1 TRINITY_DN27124_c0_g1~~TRINITY_DN27124_c0_g1_i1.p1  ORF type:complete len:244 (+),score=75.29 TRINITY_DN27124_c0_g1_i1:80-733(+)
MRTPIFTAIAPLLVWGLYGAALGTNHWAKYEEGALEARVGLLRYEVTSSASGKTPTEWTLKIKCSDTSDKGDCHTWFRVNVALLALTGLGSLILFAAWRACIWGPGTAVSKLFWAFAFGAAAAITFAATFDRIRIPEPGGGNAASRGAHELASSVLVHQVAGDTAVSDGHAAVGAVSKDPSVTLQWSFYLFCGGVFFTVATLMHHLATCSRRKHEEL